jgi:hypothetical protein
LQRVDKHDRKARATTIQYQVDGDNVESLEEAAKRLSVPPLITDEMRADLDAIGPEWGDHRKAIPHGRLKKLDNCGLIEWGERGKCRVKNVSLPGSG